MDTTVHVSKSALDYFRQRARNCPQEIHAYLIGEVHSPHHISVELIDHAREYAEQSKCRVQPTGEDYRRVKLRAENRGKRIVGDIHSHPDGDPIMSPDDHEAAIIDGMHISGIVGVHGRRTKVLFWLAGSSLPCEVSYGAFTAT